MKTTPDPAKLSLAVCHLTALQAVMLGIACMGVGSANSGLHVVELLLLYGLDGSHGIQEAAVAWLGVVSFVFGLTVHLLLMDWHFSNGRAK